MWYTRVVCAVRVRRAAPGVAHAAHAAPSYAYGVADAPPVKGSEKTMSDEAERAALVLAIKKLDRQTAWRRKRIAEDRADIERLGVERDDLALRLAELSPVKMIWDEDPADDPWGN